MFKVINTIDEIQSIESCFEKLMDHDKRDLVEALAYFGWQGDLANRDLVHAGLLGKSYGKTPGVQKMLDRVNSYFD